MFCWTYTFCFSMFPGWSMLICHTFPRIIWWMIAWHDGEANAYSMPMIASTLKKRDVFPFRCWIYVSYRFIRSMLWRHLRHVFLAKSSSWNPFLRKSQVRSGQRGFLGSRGKYQKLPREFLWSMWFFSCCNPCFFLEIISLKHTNSSSLWVLMASRRVRREWRPNS